LCIKKINDGNTIYLPPKIKRLSYFVLSGLLFFIAKRNLFTSNRWFLLVCFFRHSALIGFHEDRLVEPSPATIDWSQIPVGIPVERPLLRWIGFDCRIVYAWNSRFLIRFGLDYYSLTKVFKGKPFISKPISSLLTLRESGAFFSFFNTIVYNSALYSASELQNIIEHEKCTEQNHSIDVLLTRLFSILFWFNP
jgi:hypothetical protein